MILTFFHLKSWSLFSCQSQNMSNFFHYGGVAFAQFNCIIPILQSTPYPLWYLGTDCICLYSCGYVGWACICFSSGSRIQRIQQMWIFHCTFKLPWSDTNATTYRYVKEHCIDGYVFCIADPHLMDLRFQLIYIYIYFPSRFLLIATFCL